MTTEVSKYFQKQYKELGVRVVPGHWPDFKSKAEVDKWIEQKRQLEGFIEACIAERQTRKEESDQCR